VIKKEHIKLLIAIKKDAPVMLAHPLIALRITS